ncbi:MAG: tRNA (N6-isopentenyl adenosine(37)-C2)-methylthiotransferase MiaB [Chloroflexota bacterium]|nr:tRNA (N6-isopentenyl adenosine(37)-C2)-methylthiotransferase MiaB [Chloroflexota bacterium]
MIYYHIWTIGCQMNKADSNYIASYFEGAGCKPSLRIDEADIIIVNSCVVRLSAENKAINRIGYLRGLKKKRPSTRILVTGCLVGSDVDDLERRFPYVDLFFRPQDWQTLYDWGCDQCLPSSDGSRIISSPQVSAYVPIIQGCNNFCSYCVVPYRRGSEISRPMSEILYEVNDLVQKGTMEIILLGQNVDSYGHDLESGTDLAGLLSELNGIEGIARIRFLTNHPKDMSHKLITAINRLDKVCEHINLPCQSGDDDILHRMRRGYTVREYRRLVQEIRDVIPGVALSTDVIVGFPGESIIQFERTRELLEEVRFDMVHIAAYSPRPGTSASSLLEDDITPDEKKRRTQELEDIQAGIAKELNDLLNGSIIEVLVEGIKGGKWHGRSRSDKPVFFSSPDECLGKILRIRIDRTGPWSLQGRLNL